MTREFLRRVRKLFDEALEKPEAQRLPFLRTACDGEPDVLQAVQRLLDAHEASESFLEDDSQRRIRTIGRYVIKGELGRGAMGIVFEAVDPLIGRTVAVKTIHLQSLTGPNEAEFMRERLFREARSAGALFHPGIVVVFDVGQEGDVAFIAMERVDGRTLQQMMEDSSRIAQPVALDILRQTAAALDYAHQNGIVHRDIKPANIMLHKGSTVKIADFGIAKITTASDHTRTGMLMGTPSYMSPEQIETKPLDGRADQFSLAVVAYELLTGAKPFQGASLVQVIRVIVEGKRPSARAVNPSLPAAVDQVLERGLSKLPEGRYPNCVEFVAALEKALKDRPAEVVLATFDTAALELKKKPPVEKKPPEKKPPEEKKPVIVENKPVIQKKAKDSLPDWMVAAALVAVVGGALLFKFVGIPWSGGTPPAIVTKEEKKPPVEKPAAPVVAWFTANPESIGAGAPATLSWDVTGSTSVVIDQGIGKVDSSGTLEVRPPVSASYVLTATSPGGTVSSRVSVIVTKQQSAQQKAAEPRIVSFRAEPLSVKRGQPFRLIWKVEEASGVTIDQGVGAVRGVDSKTLTPDATTTYTMTATSKGGTVKELATVIVVAEPPPTSSGKLYEEALAQRRARQPARALALFRQSADAGEPRAMVELGRMYRAGEGAPRNLPEAARWFRKAADAGNASGMVFLGAMYAQGAGVRKDEAETARWFRKAAEAGNGAGMDGLGQLYANGQGVPRNDAEAVRWYRKASDAGNSAAMYHLGTMHEAGLGVAKDVNEALRLYQKAAAAGSAEAKARLAQGKKPARGPLSVNILGNQAWTDTGIILSAGDTVAVTASGSIAPRADGRVPPKSPAGFPSNCTVAAAVYGRTPEPYPAPQFRCWSLIGRIGGNGPIFEIGAKKTFQAKAGGKLYFGVNDNSVRDNKGSWLAAVTIQ